jgi:hypothetical protein
MQSYMNEDEVCHQCPHSSHEEKKMLTWEVNLLTDWPLTRVTEWGIQEALLLLQFKGESLTSFSRWFLK